MNWKKVLKSMYFWLIVAIIATLGVLMEVRNSTKDIDLPKFDTGSIGAQQWLAIAGLGILGIIILYVFRRVLGWVLFVGSIMGITLLYNFSYQTQDAVKKGAFAIKGRLNNAVSYTFEPKSLKETEITVPELKEGDYYVDIFSRKNIYTVKCPWEVGQRRRLFLREENVMTDPGLGNVLLRGKETPREYAVSHGGMVRIEKSRALVISFKGLPQNEIDGCQIASSTPMEIQFKEDRN